MARRRFQTGSLTLRGSRNPVWVGRWREDVIEQGQLKRMHKSVILGTRDELPTRKLALRALQSKLQHVNDYSYRPTNHITFGEVAEKWKALVLPHHKPSSQSSEKAHLDSKLIPYFGEMSMADVNNEVVQRYIGTLMVAPKTVRNILATFRMVWKSARSWGYVSHSALEGVVLPKLNLPKRRVFTLAEVQAILAAADEPWKTVFWLAAETGMRVGEICGLRIVDVNCGNGNPGVVSVRQAVWRGRVATPKSAAGVRTFRISARLSEHLRAFLAGRESDPMCYVFQTRNGKPLDARFIVRDHLHAVLDQLGIERAGMHAFRHANATIMVANGVDIKTVQKRLGHSDPTITLGIYAHGTDARDAEVAEQIGSLLCLTVPNLDANLQIPV